MKLKIWGQHNTYKDESSVGTQRSIRQSPSYYTMSQTTFSAQLVAVQSTRNGRAQDRVGTDQRLTTSSGPELSFFPCWLAVQRDATHPNNIPEHLGPAWRAYCRKCVGLYNQFLPFYKIQLQYFFRLLSLCKGANFWSRTFGRRAGRTRC